MKTSGDMVSLEDASLIITGVLFVYWQLHSMDAESIAWYMNKRKTHLPRILRFPPITFGIVWGALNIMQVAFLVLFVSYTVSTNHWTFPLVYTFFVVGVLMQKLWSVLFFRARKPHYALAVSLMLLAMATTVVVVIGVDHSNIREIWVALIVLYTLYAAWITVATTINWIWVMRQQ